MGNQSLNLIEPIFKRQATEKQMKLGERVICICIKESVKDFLKEYLSGKVGFVRNALAHVEKSHLVLAQSDASSCWL